MTIAYEQQLRGYGAAAAFLRTSLGREEVKRLATLYKGVLGRAGTLFFAGNGGSAADAQHVAAEYVGRFLRERDPLPAVALTTDSSALTAIGNDYGFEQVFRQQVMALVRSNDCLTVHTTSGKSANLNAALGWCRSLGNIRPVTVALVGSRGRCAESPTARHAEHVFYAPDDCDGPAAQLYHMMLQHLAVTLVEGA